MPLLKRSQQRYSMAKSHVGARQAETAGLSMNEIVQSVQRVDALISEMSDTASQQSDGVGHLRDSIADIARMTSENTRAVE